jgi:hypothetical protein
MIHGSGPKSHLDIKEKREVITSFEPRAPIEDGEMRVLKQAVGDEGIIQMVSFVPMTIEIEG